MIATVALSNWDLLAVAALLLVNAGVSVAFQLGLGRRLLIGAVRATIQLAFLGLVLQWVFDQNQLGIVVTLMIAMGLVAGWEAVRRTTRRAPGMLPAAMTIMVTTSFGVTAYALIAVSDGTPWWSPRYAIPIMGMVLGNALNGVSLGLETALAGFDEQRDRVEALLALGATRRQASRDVVRRAVRTGLVPILNSMVAVGIIAIPGMMTGQILGGEDPADAARYQLFILFTIAGGVALGTTGVVLTASRLLFDERDRLRLDRLRRIKDD
ncbi:MAG: putative ABC transport system permease protein [Planctomycetota bacterium]